MGVGKNAALFESISVTKTLRKNSGGVGNCVSDISVAKSTELIGRFRKLWGTQQRRESFVVEAVGEISCNSINFLVRLIDWLIDWLIVWLTVILIDSLPFIFPSRFQKYYSGKETVFKKDSVGNFEEKTKSRQEGPGQYGIAVQIGPDDLKAGR